MILDGLSLGFFSLLSCWIPLCHFITCPQPAFLNDIKPGKEAENVFFFLYCKRQEITHELRPTQHEKERIAAEFQLGEELPGGSQDPNIHSCLPNPGQTSYPTAPTSHTLGFLLLLSGELSSISVFFRLSWGHPSAFWLLLGCNPISVSSSPAWPWSHMASCKRKAFSFGFFCPRMLLSSWSESGHHFPCQQGCVCVLGCVFTAATSGTDEMVAATVPFKPAMLHL